MANNVSTTPYGGNYNVPSGSFYATGAWSQELSGTNWREATTGNRYYLECGGADGRAISEILWGKGRTTYIGDVAAGVIKNFTDGFPSDRINSNPGREPDVKWIIDQNSLALYKVIAVVDDNLVEVEYVNGIGGISPVAIGTRGLSIKQVDVNVGAGDTMPYIKYNGPNAPTPQANGADNFSLPVSLDDDGPIVFFGSTAGQINVHLDSSSERRS